MFTCRSCLQRHVRALLGDSVYQRVELRNTIVLHHASRAPGRSYSTTSRLHRNSLITGEGSKYEQSRPQSGAHKMQTTQHPIQKNWTSQRDPLVFASDVLDLLREDKFTEAHKAVQDASKYFRCTVSWNHLMNWQLSRGKVNGAIKSYNEMKKRGQKPDSHTYTILLRGMAEYPHYSQSLSKALSLYHSMDAKDSPVKPNLIHTNAILKVCARAKDMDAISGIIAKLDRKGLRAPDSVTFTTIFNAIRQQAGSPGGNLDPNEHRAIRQKAIVEARKLWVDIVDRWSQGDLWIDEELTCSMGRILLLGLPRDINDIFSLLEQTMNIPRLVHHVGAEEGNRTASVPQEDSEVATQGEKSHLIGDHPIVDSSSKDVVPHSEFGVVNPLKLALGNKNSYAKPGRNSLSLVLDALYVIRKKHSLAAYWNVFTNVHQVTPDRNNFHSYLRNLRVRRASTETVKLLLQMPKEMLVKATFRIAMAACARDLNNHLCFSNAGKILDLMQQSLSDLDLPTLHQYMDVAIHGSLYSGEPPASSDNIEQQYARGRQILRALNRLGPCVINIRSALAYNHPPPAQIKGDSETERVRQAAFMLVRKMISAYDKLINQGMVEQEMNKYLKRERSKLAAFVTRYNQKKLKPNAPDQHEERKDYDLEC